jgi:hypothetical protein
MDPLFSAAPPRGRRSTREKSGGSAVGELPGMTGSFESCKVVVVGGSSGMDKGTAGGITAGHPSHFGRKDEHSDRR